MPISLLKNKAKRIIFIAVCCAWAIVAHAEENLLQHPLHHLLSNDNEQEQKACVILLHGLARSSDSMEKLAARLTDEEYFVVNVDYPSREHNIATLAELAISEGLSSCEASHSEPIHFVTHSLGGILVRQYLSQHEIEDIGRTVMLGPPNQGSEVIDKLGNLPGFYWLNGPAGQELGTQENSIPLQLGAANFEVGIIAGSQTINFFLSSLIPGKDDGKVSIARAHLENETAFIVLPVTHPFMMKNREVIDNVLYFLKHGDFIEKKSEQ